MGFVYPDSDASLALYAFLLNVAMVAGTTRVRTHQTKDQGKQRPV